MTFSIAAKTYRVILGATDITDYVAGGGFGARLVDLSGLSPRSGSLTIRAYRYDGTGIDTDPRSNPLWGQGQPITIELTNSAGAFVLVFTGEVARTPVPASPGSSPTFELPIVDAIARRLDRQPAGDESGIELSSGGTKAGAIANLLSAAGVAASPSVPGALNAPAQKVDPGSYVAQAGAIAYSEFRCLSVDPSGAIATDSLWAQLEDYTAIATVDTTSNVVEFIPIAGSETPVERVICEGEANVVTDLEDSTTESTDEYGFAATVDPSASPDEWTLLATELITDAWSGSNRTITRDRNDARGAIIPWSTGDRLSLIPGERETTIYYYESSDEGRLQRIVKTLRRPFGAAAPDYVETASDRDTIQEIEVIASRTITEYRYRNDLTIAVNVITAEPYAVILPNENYENLPVSPEDLTTTAADYETWTKGTQNEWKYKKTEFRAIARTNPDLAIRLSTFAARASTQKIRTIYTPDSGGGNQPPAPNRRRPDKEWTTEPIDGEARFESITGASYDRSRTYQIPYCETEGRLQQHAGFLGDLLQGRAIGARITLPLTDGWLGTIAPFERLDVTDGDKTYAYLINGVQFAWDERSRRVGGELIFLGEVATLARPWRRRTLLRFGSGRAIALNFAQGFNTARRIQLASERAIRWTVQLTPRAIRFATRSAIRLDASPILYPLRFASERAIALPILTDTYPLKIATVSAVTLSGENMPDPATNGWVACWNARNSVAVGTADGTTWIETSTGDFRAISSTGTYQNIAVGNGFVLIAGQNSVTSNGAILRGSTSDDLSIPGNWTRYESGLPAASRCEKITYCGGSVFIMEVAGNAVYSTSNNGASWIMERSTNSPSPAGNPATDTGWFNDGFTGYSASPGDGTYASLGNIAMFVGAARYGDGRLLITEGSTTGDFKYSDDDGVSYSTQTAIGVNGFHRDMAWVSGNTWIMASGSTAVSRTTDITSGGFTSIALARNAFGIDYAPNGIAIVVCSSGRYYRSTDDGASFIGDIELVTGISNNLQSVRSF